MESLKLEESWILVSSEVDPGTSSLWILKDDYVTWSRKTNPYSHYLLVSLDAPYLIMDVMHLLSSHLKFFKIITK